MILDEALERLGVTNTVDAEALRRAFLHKARECHPDKGGAHEQFLALQEAFDIVVKILPDPSAAKVDINGQDLYRPEIYRLLATCKSKAPVSVAEVSPAKAIYRDSIDNLVNTLNNRLRKSDPEPTFERPQERVEPAPDLYRPGLQNLVARLVRK